MSSAGHLPVRQGFTSGGSAEIAGGIRCGDGEFYLGFCQAIAENSLDCLSYAVDTWESDPDPDNFQDVWDYNEIHYRSFSHLLRTSFDEALTQFADGSIDILHLSGPHSYEQISHVFHTWLPKVRAGGFVLFRNAAARHGDFGVWRLWDELDAYGRRFRFRHSGGLGVFEKAANEQPDSGIRSALFEGDERQQEHIRRFYSLCADGLEFQHMAEKANASEGRQKAALLELADARRDLLAGAASGR